MIPELQAVIISFMNKRNVLNLLRHTSIIQNLRFNIRNLKFNFSYLDIVKLNIIFVTKIS